MTASILDALDDPDLFGPHFRGDTWAAWRTFLAALFAGPLDEDALVLYRAHTGRQTAPVRAFAEAALIVGRRGGKSRVLALVAVYLACFRDYEPHLAPGEVATVAVLAADRKQARAIMRYVAGLLTAVPMLKQMVGHQGDDAIVMRNRVNIEVSTASFRTTRGYTFAAVLADEVAFWRSDEASANPDAEILRALRPGMASIPGAMLLLASSPYAKRGELYATFRRHYGVDGSRVLVWKADTASMNPRIDPEIIAEAYDTDPEAARAEYGAEFRDDLADFVTREIVDAVTAIGRGNLPPEPGVTYAAFVDPSGGASDAMTLAIAHLTADGIGVVDAIAEARPPFSPEDVVAEFAALLRTYGITRIIGDRYGGEWPRQRFREHGVVYEPSARAKSDLYVDFLPLLNAKRVELLDHPRTAAQLVGLERRTARSGRDSVDHSPGGHDDLANVVAGVLVGLDLDRRPALVAKAALLMAGIAPPLPKHCSCVFATLAMGEDGMMAVVYAAGLDKPSTRMMVLDFDTGPLGGATFHAVPARLAVLAEQCKPSFGSIGLFLPVALHAQARMTGLAPQELPEELADPAQLPLFVAFHVSSGAVKISSVVAEKAVTSPWGGALDFKLGDRTDTPLRTAALQAVAIALGTGT